MKSFYNGRNVMEKMGAYIFAGLCLIVLSSCSGLVLEQENIGFMRISASPDECAGLSRSVLEPTAEYEDMISDMTLAAFDNETGYLVSCMYHDSGDLCISLPMDRTYRIYLMANMGDRTGDMPHRMGDMEQFRYDLKSYSVLKKTGLPMSVSVITPWTGELNLNLRRLMAKLVVTVDKSDISEMGGGGDDSFRNLKMKLNRVARALYPFAPGGSAAKNAEDIFGDDGVEYAVFTDATTAYSEELVMYVPENAQGMKLEGNTSSDEKSESNAELSGEELCTYISLDAYKNGTSDGVYGKLVYRFFPGLDNVSNFDLIGGKTYHIKLKLTWNGMYTVGDWKVERSAWSDRRKIFVSLDPDGGFGKSLTVNLARGSSEVPLYIYYAPQGYVYESEKDGGAPHHYEKGWMFTPVSSLGGSGGLPYPRDNTGNFPGTRISTGFVGYGDYYTMHYVTIPKTTPVGYSNIIRYSTWDSRAFASLKIQVAEAGILFSPSSMLFLFYEYGYESRRTISVLSSSPVRPCNIAFYTDFPDLITLDHYDAVKGTVDVYWNGANNGSSPKTANVYLHSENCGVTAVCTLVQQNRAEISVGEPEDGGRGEIEY